jgi:hypothetical protein
MSRLNEIDLEVRKFPFSSRVLQEETGISDEPPIRRTGESDTYWYTRLLAFDLIGAYYRTPQMNMKMIVDYVNSRTFGVKRITSFSFSAPRTENLKFETPNGKVTFDAHSRIDPSTFLRKFGLE